jgi:hypothetical protein
MKKLFAGLTVLPYTQLLLLLIATLLYFNLDELKAMNSGIESLKLDVEGIQRNMPDR